VGGFYGARLPFLRSLNGVGEEGEVWWLRALSLFAKTVPSPQEAGGGEWFLNLVGDRGKNWRGPDVETSGRVDAKEEYWSRENRGG